MFKEFREFASKGNMVDLAVGVIIGAAFGAMITSLVNDIISPIIGIMTGGIDFSRLYIQLTGESQDTLEAAQEAGATLAYGNFITVIINFVIVAFILFLIIRAMNRMRRKQEAAPEAAPTPPPNDEVLLGEIRDLLKAQTK